MTVDEFVDLLYNYGMHGVSCIDTEFEVDISQPDGKTLVFSFKFNKDISDIIVEE